MLLAAGCGVLDDSYVAPDVCPMPAILEDLQELVRFKPGMGTDISQAQFHMKFGVLREYLRLQCKWSSAAISVLTLK